MIHTCSRCKKDFLTEADPYIYTPVTQELKCLCVIDDLKEKLKEAVEICGNLFADLNVVHFHINRETHEKTYYRIHNTLVKYEYFRDKITKENDEN